MQLILQKKMVGNIQDFPSFHTCFLSSINCMSLFSIVHGAILVGNYMLQLAQDVMKK